MACVCRGYNVQSDWLIVTELKGIILTYICDYGLVRTLSDVK